VDFYEIHAVDFVGIGLCVENRLQGNCGDKLLVATSFQLVDSYVSFLEIIEMPLQAGSL
jgi:hypothetical protein